jgi:hypothetical protein
MVCLSHMHRYPVIKRHSLAGKCRVPLAGISLFEEASQTATDMALCILSDRGFRVTAVTETAALSSRTKQLVVKWDVPVLRLQ